MSAYPSLRPLLAVVLLFVGSITAKGQLVDVNACSGNLTRCVSETDTSYVMCFNVIPASICAYNKFTIIWGDGTPLETVNGPGPVQVKHTYKLGNFGKFCQSGGVLKYETAPAITLPATWFFC